MNWVPREVAWRYPARVSDTMIGGCTLWVILEESFGEGVRVASMGTVTLGSMPPT